MKTGMQSIRKRLMIHLCARILALLLVSLGLFAGCSQKRSNANYFSKRGAHQASTKFVHAQNPRTQPAIHIRPGVKVYQSRETSANPSMGNTALLNEASTLCDQSQIHWRSGKLDKALEVLDMAYYLILKATPGGDPQLIQRKKSLRVEISRRILEISASSKHIAQGRHSVIPLVLNKHVRAQIDNFVMGKEKQFFRKTYQRSGRYRPFIVARLKKAGLPAELSWLPLIESGYKVDALSKSRALGLWQFIPTTGYKYGLKRTHYIDERMDPYKSTDAAIAYLIELHRIFGDWLTALAGYNCGEGRVIRTIRKQRINYLDRFWDLYDRLPNETAQYVPRFIAALHIVNNPERYGLDDVQLDAPLQFETVKIDARMRLKDIGKMIQSSRSELQTLNPELRLAMAPGKGYPLKIPHGKKALLMAHLNSSAIGPRPSGRHYLKYRVKPGDTLASIARRHGVSMQLIARANHRGIHDTLPAGQTLLIPTFSSTASRTPKRGATQAKRVVHHTVRKGDSIWNIAQRYGSSVREIRAINNLNSTILAVGQVLKAPAYKY